MRPSDSDAERLFREYHPLLIRYLRRLSGDADAAEDAAQEAFLQLVRHRPDPVHLRSWLFKTATNALRQAMRTSARRRQLLLERTDRLPIGDPDPTPDERLDASEAWRRIDGALAALPPQLRTMLVMREEGFTYREIAEAVGANPASVGTMIARALDRLASDLALDEEITR